MPNSMLVRRWRPLVAVAWAAGVVNLTLLTAGEDPKVIAELPSLCLVCGTRGTSDALLNVALFLPLGLVLGGMRTAFLNAAIAGLAISLGIEGLQMLLPGRHAGLSDLVWNAVGAVVGVVLYRTIRSRMAGSGRIRGASVGAAVAVGLVAMGFLHTPAPTHDAYWSQWTPDLGHMPQYGGRVLEAGLDDRALPPGRIDASASHRRLFEGEWVLSARFVVGPPPSAVSPIFSVYDAHRREIALLGAMGDDLVFREHRLASALRFDVADHRLLDAFAAHPVGDTLVIQARRGADDTCVRLGTLERCGVGTTPGRTWGLLMYLEGVSEGLRRAVDVGWLAMLFVAVGFFGRTPADAAAGTGIAMAGQAVGVWATPLIAGAWLEWIAGPVGVLLGLGAREALARVARTDAQPAESMAASV